MEEAIFVEGVPRRVTVQDIRRWYLAAFPKLTDDKYLPVIEEAIDAAYTMFTGGQTMFDLQPKQIWYEKTLFFYRSLTCWYMANHYPTLVAGVPTMGGIPLKSKKIGPTTITYADQVDNGVPSYQDVLAALKTNTWGIDAYTMIRSCGKRVQLGLIRYV